jgi:DNA replication protein DnaC
MLRSFFDLCDELVDAKCGRLRRSGYYRDERLTARGFWNEWAAADLCIVDEIGIQPTVSGSHFEAMYQAVERREHLPLILLGNVGPDELLDMFGARVHSRIAAGTIVEVTGPDQRIEPIAARNFPT